MLNFILGLCLIFLLLVFVLFLYCAIVLNKDANEKQRQIDIKDQYFALICAIGYDYNGSDNKEELEQVIDKIVDLSIKGVLNDDKSFLGVSSDNKEFNILGEEKDNIMQGSD